MKIWKIGKNAFAEFIYVYAESFDKALAIARKLDNRFCEGQVIDMFKIQVWFDNHWKDGIPSYASYDEANIRLNRLLEVGIKARIVKEV